MNIRLNTVSFLRHMRFSSRRAFNRGLTLVELLVAMAVSLLVVLAAVAALIASRRGATTVDVAGQLRDNGRFATETIQRLAVQTGFEDMQYAVLPYMTTIGSYASANRVNNDAGGSGIEITSLRPNLLGYNNAVPSSTDPLNVSQAHASGFAGRGSDTIIFQYQPVKGNPSDADGGVNADGSMIDCAGNAPVVSASDRNDRIASILYVGPDKQGEPSLMCMTKGAGGTYTSTPLIRGVESFQVLYGVDNVDANAIPQGDVSTVPNGYLRADQLIVPGDENATYTNWRRVRSLRIGLVLRGPAGSAQETASQTYYPLGSASYSGTGDQGAKFTVNDNRLRQVVTFTVLLRNCQNQGYQPEPSDPNNPIPCNVVLPS